jgi:hypothetical protein
MYVSNSIIISKSNITSSTESTDYTTDPTHIHVICTGKHKSSRHAATRKVDSGETASAGRAMKSTTKREKQPGGKP